MLSDVAPFLRYYHFFHCLRGCDLDVSFSFELSMKLEIEKPRTLPGLCVNSVIFLMNES